MDAASFYRRYWDDKNIAVNSFDHHPGEWTKENFDFHMEFFKPYVGNTILDFGCGDGQFLHHMSRISPSVHGIDISDKVIQVAKERYPHLELKVFSGERIPYPDEHFDTVTSIDVFEHLVDTETALEEIRRVLKPRGHLLIATSELTRIKTIIIALFYLDKYFYPASPHVRYFTRKNLADFLRRKGFRAIKYMKNRVYFGFIPQGQLVVAEKVASDETPGKRQGD